MTTVIILSSSSVTEKSIGTGAYREPRTKKGMADTRASGSASMKKITPQTDRPHRSLGDLVLGNSPVEEIATQPGSSGNQKHWGSHVPPLPWHGWNIAYRIVVAFSANRSDPINIGLLSDIGCFRPVSDLEPIIFSNMRH